MMTALEIIEKEFDDWLEKGDCETQIELSDYLDDKIETLIGDEEHQVSISFPESYPKSDSKEWLSVTVSEEKLQQWQSDVNQFISAKKPRLPALLDYMSEHFAQSFKTRTSKQNKEETTSDGENHLDEDFDDLDITSNERTTSKEDEIERKKINRQFLEIGSASATMRLISDLKSIKRQDASHLGFSADPVVDSQSNMENLYHWHVKLFGFDPESDIAKDLKKFEDVTGQNYILLEMKFSSDYPHMPPFVRVVKPRFAFQTGHVTVGGSICMDLLTVSGWNAANDIESILIQIRAEMATGGARLDEGMGKDYEYTEIETWEAFHKAAKGHGWSTEGLQPSLYQLKK